LIIAQGRGQKDKAFGMIVEFRDRTLPSFERVIAALEAKRCKLIQKGSGKVRAQCPAHPDSRPSLAITASDGRTLLKCWAGCKTADIVREIGLRMCDLFDSSVSASRPVIVATYRYVLTTGELIAEKVRLHPKAFKFRRPVASGWRWGLDGAALPLYRAPDLVKAALTVLVEGEKAVEELRARGFVATCPPFGASAWDDRWREELIQAGCKRVVILPDADVPGIQHAARVSVNCGERLRVVIIKLPGLPDKGDVVDWFGQGNTADDLRRLIDAAPDWTPDGERQAKEQRRRELARERKRRQRARQQAAITGRSADVA
jgi:putative DNA primase/helicase